MTKRESKKMAVQAASLRRQDKIRRNAGKLCVMELRWRKAELNAAKRTKRSPKAARETGSKAAGVDVLGPGRVLAPRAKRTLTRPGELARIVFGG